MGKLDDQYLFVLKDLDDRLPSLTPDDDTSRKPYLSERLPLHVKPLVFYNGALDYQKHNGIVPVDPPPQLLFHGSDILIKDSVREKLLLLEIPDLAIQPAIYIDHKGGWHEDYWYLTFLELLDCWDRDRSSYDPDPIELNEDRLYDVYQYSLNDELLEKVPFDSRRLFKMGGTLDGDVVVHVSLAEHLRLSGAVLIPIAEYGVSFP